MPLRRTLLLLAALPVLACRQDPGVGGDDVPVEVGMVAVDPSNSPVVILEEQEGERWLPIWVGSFEARSIAAEIDEEKPPRPNTHDLARSLIAGLEGVVERVVVTELRGGTYYALLWVRANGRVLQIDARPSDAIAIALRAGAPIFVRSGVFEAASEGSDSDPGRPIRWRRAPPPAPAPAGSPEATPGLEL